MTFHSGMATGSACSGREALLQQLLIGTGEVAPNTVLVTAH